MSKYGLLINYEWCSGCHSCEIACKNEHNIPLGQWGIKVVDVGPFQIAEEDWEWSHVPIPTKICDFCEERLAEGKNPACVHNCLAFCLEYGTVEDLSAKIGTGVAGKSFIYTP